MTETFSPTHALAQFVANASFDDLPGEVTRAAKRYIGDAVANMIGGARLAPGRIVLELFEPVGGRPESTIMATGASVPCLNAAYVNAALSNLLDFDDCYLYISHPGATIVPAALSVGEKLGVSGRELINAVVVGYEVSLRICDAIRASVGRFEQVWGMSTWEIFGAAAAAAKLLKLDAEGVATAFGHAGMSAPVPFLGKLTEPEARPLSWLKNNFGWATMGGVLAAELAARGMVGNRTIFDGPRGFWIMAGSDRCEPERFTAGLGDEYLMLATGIKPYACCRWTHTSIEAVEEILSDHQVDPRQIHSIRIETLTAIRDTFDVRQPVSIIDAQFALPPLVALTLAGHSPARGIDETRLNDPLVQELIAKVEITASEEADHQFHHQRKMPARVLVEMADGSLFEASRLTAKGEPERPLSERELEEKFLGVTGPVLGLARSRRILSQLDVLESVGVCDVTGAVVPGAASGAGPSVPARSSKQEVVAHS